MGLTLTLSDGGWATVENQFGLAVGLAVLALWNGSVRVSAIKQLLGINAGLYALSCLAASVLGCWIVTRRNVLELLQTKE